jgi:hypothetical protein
VREQAGVHASLTCPIACNSAIKLVGNILVVYETCGAHAFSIVQLGKAVEEALLMRRMKTEVEPILQKTNSLL